jgi:hypothetical protein
MGREFARSEEVKTELNMQRSQRTIPELLNRQEKVYGRHAPMGRTHSYAPMLICPLLLMRGLPA